jgi:hypothetical protein
MTGLGDHPEVFKAKKARGFMDYFEDASSESSKFKGIVEQVLQTRLSGQPLFLMPGASIY